MDSIFYIDPWIVKYEFFGTEIWDLVIINVIIIGLILIAFLLYMSNNVLFKISGVPSK
ncbi:MAG: hypothetical protein ACW981_13150 [Candidatus Hodarchaeales archaeon]